MNEKMFVILAWVVGLIFGLWSGHKSSATDFERACMYNNVVELNGYGYICIPTKHIPEPKVQDNSIDGRVS